MLVFILDSKVINKFKKKINETISRSIVSQEALFDMLSPPAYIHIYIPRIHYQLLSFEQKKKVKRKLKYLLHSLNRYLLNVKGFENQKKIVT